MFPVSTGFLARLSGFRRLVTTVTVTTPAGDVVTLGVKAGRVSVSSDLLRRRTISLQLVTTAAEFAAVTTPGSVIRVDQGHWAGNVPDTVPVFTGEVVKASRNPENGDTSVDGQDLSVWLERSRFLTPWAATPGMTRVALISSLVTAARPGTTVDDQSHDTGAVESAATWDESRTDAIQALATDSGVECFFGPDGVFVIRRVPELTDGIVWTIRPGDGGTLTGVERSIPLDRLYNTVVVRPSASDGSQTWAPQVVQVTDPEHPRHPDKIGVVPYFWASPTITTAETAAAAGWKILTRVLGKAETLSLSAVGNPALEGGDVIRVVTPAMRGEAADAVTHFVDAFTLDLATGGMTVDTRAVSGVDDA